MTIINQREERCTLCHETVHAGEGQVLVWNGVTSAVHKPCLENYALRIQNIGISAVGAWVCTTPCNQQPCTCHDPVLFAEQFGSTCVLGHVPSWISRETYLDRLVRQRKADKELKEETKTF